MVMENKVYECLAVHHSLPPLPELCSCYPHERKECAPGNPLPSFLLYIIPFGCLLLFPTCIFSKQPANWKSFHYQDDCVENVT